MRRSFLPAKPRRWAMGGDLLSVKIMGGERTDPSACGLRMTQKGSK